MRFSFLAASLLTTSLAATASGFETGPQGARLLGLSGAGTAYTGTIAGLSINPGLLGQWADSATQVSLGGMAQVRRSSFVGRDTYTRTDQDLSIQPGGYLYAAHSLSPKLAVGLGLTTPYGYHTQWPTGWQGRSVVQESQLNTYFVQPTVAYRLSENFSFGAGFIYGYGKYSQTRSLGQFDNTDAQASFSASGSGVGGTVGLYGRSGENLSFGISFRSGLNLKLDNGTLTNTGVPPRDAALYPASTAARTQLKLPNSLSVGLADQVTKKLLLTLDFTLTGWSPLDSLNFVPTATDAPRSQQVRRRVGYEDVLAFRFGTEYRLSPQLTLLGGLHYEETPVRDEYINPEFLDANRVGASVGLSYQASTRLAVEAGYSFDYGQLRTARVNQSVSSVSNISGSYRTVVNLASVGVAFKL